jgi:hypothetical protein
MTLNYQQVHDRIVEIGKGARLRRESLDGLRRHASGLLEEWAGKAADLTGKVERARQADPGLRCALPLDEPLDASLDPGPAQKDFDLVAADGSQIAPDRHAPVLYGLINVGAIVMTSGSGQAPRVLTDSSLFFDQEVAGWTDGLVALRRDLAERKKLLDLSKACRRPLVTLTDGPLQLWEAHESSEVFGYEKALGEYLSVLSQLHAGGVITAGYVDKPSSNLLVRLLEVAVTPESELKEIHSRHPLNGVSDRWLLERVVRPGQRSAVFALQARSKAVYEGALALHFFYLNVGSEKHPSLVRVEIPQWVAGDPGMLGLLHACLLDQCRIMGARPYPYILHRAHEVAVVRHEEKRQVDQMLALELRRSGGEVEQVSAKQSAKDLPGRGRNP